VWEHRGKVAVVGIGHAPTSRRWDETVDTSVGALTIFAIQKALEDAGVKPEDVDGVVATPKGMGEPWTPRPIPEDFANAYTPTDDPNDGLDGASADWIVQNTPGLSNVSFTAHGPACISNALVVAAEAVGSGLTNTCLVVRGMGNIAGRYGQHGAAAMDTAAGASQWTNPWGWQLIPQIAFGFDQYCRKYGKNHDMMAPFVVNEKRNGLMFPEGFWAQHRPEPLSIEDYLAARWVAKPANLFDCDLPIQVVCAYLFTTAERARDMKQKPIYVMNHNQGNTGRPRSSQITCDEQEVANAMAAQMAYEGSGWTPRDVDIFNPYDGYSWFLPFFLEAFGWHGVGYGEARDFFNGDISVEGPHPFCSGGGNLGNGRTRTSMYIDSIQQLRGTAGARQVNVKAETAICAFAPFTSSAYLCLSNVPS
jgi:acetyl-CoA acetyltransferase